MAKGAHRSVRTTHGARGWRRCLAVAAGWLVVATGLQAATWVVAAGSELPTMAEALQRAADGDLIEVQPGTYRGDVAVIGQRRLTIRGVGERPLFVADGRHAEGKAIWVVRNGDITIENIEFRGARVPDLNGAGIRFERGRLRILRCAFFDNEMGLLASNDAQAELHIEDSDFGQAPTHPGDLHHLLYVGRLAQVTITGSRFAQGYVGHLIKSRARRSVITGNTIVDGPDGRASYEIDLPNGGLAHIAGNTIGQSARTENITLVAYGAEGKAWPDSALTVEGNTMVSERPGHAWFVRAWADRLPPGSSIQVRRNRLIGNGAMSLMPGATVEDNLIVTRP